MTIKEMREKMRKNVEDARAKLTEIDAAKDETRAAEIEAEYDAIMAEHDDLEKQVAKAEASEAREARQTELEQRRDSRRPQGSDARSDDAPGDDRPDPEAAYRTAFGEYLSLGLSELSSEQRSMIRERRAQAIGTDAKGGFLVPEGFISELVTTMQAYSPMFVDTGAARQIVTASGNPLPMPTEDDTGEEAVLIAENTAAADDDMDVGQLVFGAYKYTAKNIKVSAEFIQDTAIDAEAWVRDAMATRFSRGIGRHLTVGTGTAQPQGIVTGAGAGVTAAAVAGITFDELIELQHSVDPAYRSAPAVSWMFHDTTLKLLRKIKDADGNFIWQPTNVQTGAPASLLGTTYRVNQAMAVPAAGARSVIFGDLNKYAVRRVREVSVRRLDERYADADQVGFLGFARVDGKMLDASAIKALTQAAS